VHQNLKVMALYIGNLMMPGLRFRGPVSIILADGSLFNTWLKDYIMMLPYFT
jgi:hypothetical protein